MKLFLCIAAIAISTYIGRLLAKRLKQRYGYLLCFQSDLLQLTQRIVSMNMPLQSALRMAGDSPVSKLLCECAAELEKHPQSSFEKLWSGVINNSRMSFLSKEDVSIIVGAGAVIEALCKNPSSEQAQFYNDRLSKYIEEAHNDVQKKRKLFTTAGVLFGLLTALLII